MSSLNVSMSKRGFLLGEFTLKTVLAILGILLLIYLLATLYATFSKQKAIEQATGGVDRVLEGIRIAATSEGGAPYQYILTEPKGWKLIHYPSGLSSVPECSGVQCVCLCQVPSFWRIFTSQQSYCADAGVCKKVQGIAFAMPSDVVIDGPTGISIRRDGEGVVRLTHP